MDSWNGVARTSGWAGLVGALLWFLVGLTVLLRRAEGDPPWRSTVALASAVLLPAYYLVNASWASAAHRGLELDPAVAAYAYDIGNIGFANTWLALGSFAGAAGWVMLTSGGWPRWLGWWGAVAGVGILLARFVWTIESAWFAPYGVFWIWLLTVAVRLVMGRDVPAARAVAGTA